MGENEDKIEYSPEEQLEIDRIVNYLSQETMANLPDASPVHHEEEIEDSNAQEYKSGIKQYEGIPDDMGFESEDITEEEPVDEEIQDITGLIQELGEETGEEKTGETTEEDLEGISFPEEPGEEPSVPEIAEEDFPESPEAGDIGTPGEASEEPAEEFDLSSISEELEKHQVDETPAIEEEAEIVPEQTTKLPVEEESEPLLDMDTFKELESSLDDLSFEEAKPAPAPEAEKPEGESFDMDMADLTSAPPAAEEPKAAPQADEFADLDIDLEIPEGIEESPAKKAPPKEAIGAELDELDQLDEISKEKKPAESADFTIEPLEDISGPGDITGPGKAEEPGTGA